eukprot:TRINITY_DN7030_c0_g1_i10.p2 TRINITY_DN7030_c0_g1~~TRINITY_DN7030_c0_g1_i10.p2  ORF type:complete len:217 (-),score=57.04 TRINITY_DN7030_c0_g1_i10:128-778(-)
MKKLMFDNLKRVKLAKGGGFSVVGSKKFVKSAAPPCMIIRSQVVSSFGNSAQMASSGFHKTQKRSFTERERAEQVNVILTPGRPTTAAVKVGEGAEGWPATWGRPMTACVAKGSSLKKCRQYVPTAYIKPFSARPRPISAAVSSRISLDKECLERIDPEKVKTKYLRYLKELETEAKNFIIEEDNGQKLNSEEPTEQKRCNSRVDKKRVKMLKVSI